MPVGVPDAMPDAGEPFGRYVLLERVAAGGMAEIFKARTASLGAFEKILAIKRLHAGFGEDQDFVRMLLDEARIAGLLSHAAVAQIYDVGVVGSHYYIAMEYVRGQSTYDLLKAVYARRTHLPVALACHIVSEVSSALHHAHTVTDHAGNAMEIVHRDISPQNVMVSYEGDVKVVDFGIAKAAQRSTSTQAGVIKGKFYYMAPEQARGEKVDHRCDIFATGILLYELLTTHPCYDDDDNAVLLDRVKDAQFVPPRQYRPDLPGSLEAIVLKAMALDPDDRYPSALDLAWDLTRFLKSANLHPTRLHLREYMARLFAPEIRADAASTAAPVLTTSPGYLPRSGPGLAPAIARPDPAPLGSPHPKLDDGARGHRDTRVGSGDMAIDPGLSQMGPEGEIFADRLTRPDGVAASDLSLSLKIVYGGVALLGIANLLMFILTRR